jgi:hypothetical protein
MKLSKILQGAAIIALTAFTTGCVSSRYPYPPGPPAPGSSFSLIIDPYPGISVNRYHDGRYYYRNEQGYTYWRGNDNRYYLDRSYLGRNYYKHRQYNDWSRNGNYNNRHHRY